MPKLFSWTWLWIVLGFLCLLISLAIDLETGTVDLTQRSGALFALCGAIAGARSFLRSSVGEIVKDRTIIGGGTAANEKFEQTRIQVRADAVAERVSIGMAVFGVVISSYLDVFWNAVQRLN